MTNRTKIALAAALIAAFASPALAKDGQITKSHQARYESSVVEGRNAAVIGNVEGSTSSDRDALVQQLGN